MGQLSALFPGQGSQSVGMGSELLAEFPLAKLTFEEAEDACHLPLRSLCLNGPADKLALTANQQPCLLTLSIAVWRILQAEIGFDADFFAGHSLGEYSALVAAGKLPLAQAAALVHQRGLAMQTAVPVGAGAMAAVLGQNPEHLVSLCQQLSSELKLCVEVVNFNSPQQQIISGHQQAVEQACALLSQQGLKTIALPVSAPFHSSLMAPARQAMTPLLSPLRFPQTAGRMVANLTGKIEPEYHPDLLIAQIDQPVLWTECLQSTWAAGSDTYVEIGPGKVLFGLARRCLPKTARLFHSETIRDALKQLPALRS